ncbi:MAG TPA: hypothetical protein VFH06_00025 [Candidatus Saccharimonadales bacterium]|nr:hypothetical protein [Candidatus Saccharimonadales bacterium]
MTIPLWIRSRWFRFGAPAGLILLAMGAYIFWSGTTWSDYQMHFTRLQDEARSKIKGSLELKVETNEDRMKKLDSLRSSRDILADDNSLCRVNMLVDWQSFIGNLKDQKQKCNEVQTKLVHLRDALDKIIEYLENDHILAESLGTIPAGGEIAEDAWVGQRDGYRAAQKHIAERTVSNEFAPVKQMAEEKLNGIVAAWEEILAAHGAKDKVRFTKAVATLSQGYDALSNIGKVSSDHFQVLVKSFENDYIKL